MIQPKKYLHIGIAVILFACVSCRKSTENKFCWDCEVTRRDGTTFKDRPCNTTGFPPQYHDDLGNDLNSFCTKR